MPLPTVDRDAVRARMDAFRRDLPTASGSYVLPDGRRITFSAERRGKTIVYVDDLVSTFLAWKGGRWRRGLGGKPTDPTAPIPDGLAVLLRHVLLRVEQLLLGWSPKVSGGLSGQDGLPEGLRIAVFARGSDWFVLEARDGGRLLGRIRVDRQGRVVRERFDADRPSGHRWVDVRGDEWAVTAARVPGPRRGLGTRLYAAAAEEVRRRGGAFLSSDTIRSESAQAFWAKLERRFPHRVVFHGGSYFIHLAAMPARIDLS